MTLVAAQDRLTLIGVFLHAAPLVKLIVLGLFVATIAALGVCAGKLGSAPRLAGGSAFLSGLRVGGPLTGLLGAAWAGLGMALGLANVLGPVPVSVLARGYSEIMLLIVMGLLAGAVAVVANWAVESRIDRTVLKA
jgi:hypothetical protein